MSTDSSLDPDRADAKALRQLHRNYWSIEVRHGALDDSQKWDEDNCHIHTKHGPQNMSSLRRFAIFILTKRRRNSSISLMNKLIRLMCKPRPVLDYLRLTAHARGHRHRTAMG
ncbi:MAG: hypothetical protein OXC68_03685 [Aestuariivita sp.]|nr:hypothetical protein [Aestuariivita sp.]